MEISGPNPVSLVQRKGLNFASGKGVQFNSGSLLSLFATATVTPTDISGAGIAFSGVSVRYFRVGGLVSYQFWFTYANNANATNAAVSSGLPVAPPSNSGHIDQFFQYSGPGAVQMNASGNMSFATSAGAALRNIDFANITVRGSYVTNEF